MGKVSIIIPCYNYAKYLEECVESAVNQTVKPYEIIIVNDGSTDHTNKEAQLLIDKYPLHNILLIEKANGGLSSARNAGIRAATGDWILCLDADDTIAENFLEFTIGVDDIIPTYQQEFGERHNTLQWLEHPKFENFMPFNQIPAGCLFKREIWEKVGGYDEEMRKGYEDWEFWLRALMAGYTVTTVPFKLFNYRIHKDSMINKTIERHDEIVGYIKNKLNIC